MAERGQFSRSFLRETGLIAISEVESDMEGNDVAHLNILKEALSIREDGSLVRNKMNISKIFDNHNIKYRMVFNAMNMSSYTYSEVQEAVDHMADYINDMGVSGIVEFHAADKTQNSDHLHFWINTEDRGVYQKIALEMISQEYSNAEDVFIQKYETNDIIREEEHVNTEDTMLSERFENPSIGREAGEYLESLDDMLDDLNEDEEQTPLVDEEITKEAGLISTVVKTYDATLQRIKALLKKSSSIEEEKVSTVNMSETDKKDIESNEDSLFWNKFKDEAHNSFDIHLGSFKNSKYKVVRECTLQDNKTYSILSRIEGLKNKLARK